MRNVMVVCVLAAGAVVAGCGNDVSARRDGSTGGRDAGDAFRDVGAGDGVDAFRADTGAIDSGSSDSGPPPTRRTCEPCDRGSDCIDGYCASLVTGGQACLPGCVADLPSCQRRFSCVLDISTGIDTTICAPLGGLCCVDEDGDGYGQGVGCAGSDCNDNDPDVHPDRDEICDGGDTDCDMMVDERPYDCARGLCIDGECGRCVLRTDCPAGDVCRDGVCSACASRSECAPGEVCASGRCGPCASRADCEAGEVCISGACGPCASSSDCAPTEACIAGRCGPCTTSGECVAGRVCEGGSCAAGSSHAMHQCPGVGPGSLGGGAWGNYPCEGQIWSVPACTTIEYPSSSSSTCDRVGRIALTTDSAPPAGARHVPMHQCPPRMGLGGGAWGYYGCQGQLSSRSSCQIIEYPSNTSFACPLVGNMAVYSAPPSPPPGGTVVPMYDCPPRMSLGGGSWGWYGCEGEIESTPTCMIIEHPSSMTYSCAPTGWIVLEP